MFDRVFDGCATAIVTPMKSDGTIDFDLFGDLLEFQLAKRIDAVVVAGTTGEASVLNDEEHCKLIEYAVHKVDHRVPVIVGTGSNNTEHAIELSQEAAKLGADSLLQVTPYYNKTSQKGLVRHFTKIAEIGRAHV